MKRSNALNGSFKSIEEAPPPFCYRTPEVVVVVVVGPSLGAAFGQDMVEGLL
jgi:hypothetical protein